mgnify:CR=1 FL=1
MKIPIYDRQWFIDRFIKQKEKEEEAIKKARKG